MDPTELYKFELKIIVIYGVENKIAVEKEKERPISIEINLSNLIQSMNNILTWTMMIMIIIIAIIIITIIIQSQI